MSTDHITLSIATGLNETNYLVYMHALHQGCQDCGADILGFCISWPVGDTIITHFALSDEKGNVLLKEVPGMEVGADGSV